MRDTVREYFTAIINDDGAKACSLVEPEQQRELVAQTPRKESCEQFLSNFFPKSGRRYFTMGSNKVYEEDLDDLRVEVRVTGDRATAKPRGAEGTFGLTKRSGGWKISDLGQ